MSKVTVLWSLRGRTVVEIPNSVDLGDDEAVEDAVRETMGNDYTLAEWQDDSDGYEIDELRFDEWEAA